nr:ATP-binding protein [uncultured Noviherbaspirillum sp.]
MLFDRLVAGSLARRFAFSAAALAAAALMLTLLASWALVAQQHASGLRELQKKEMDFHEASVRGTLKALATRLGDVADSAILANALVDSAGRETYLRPYLNGTRQVNGVPVQLMLTDFEGNAISESAGATFAPAQQAWLRQQLDKAVDAATVMETADGPALLAVRLLRYTRTQSPEGALLYKVRLDDIEKDGAIRLLAGPRERAPAEDLRVVDVPPAYGGLGLTLVRTGAAPIDYSALLPHYALILVVVLALSGAVLLLGSRLALALTRDLRRLEGFSSSVVRDGFGERRADVSGSREVASLAHSINHMVDRLHHQHAQLQNESERFHQLANTIPQMAWIASADGRVEWYNDRWYAYTGIGPAEAAGEGWRQALDEADLPAILGQWRDGIAAGEPFSLTITMRGADRQLRRFLTQLAPLRDAGGRVVQWFGTNTDLTPLEQAERAVRESEERLREGLQAANMAAWTWDLDSGETRYSDNADAVFGSAWRAGSRDWSFLPEADRVRLRDIAQDALRRHASYRCEVELPGAGSADLRWIEVRGKADSRTGAPGSSSGIALDVSERKRAEVALLLADQRKDEFLAMLAHELRNPLAPISSAVRIMELVAPDAPPQVRKAREVIDRQTRHLSRLVDDLMDVSRISTGKIVLRDEPVDAAAMVLRAIEMNRPLLEARGHRLETDGLSQQQMLRGDSTRLTQVIGNLINNAAKYTEAGGRISVSLAREGDWLTIRVADNGVGMAPQILPHVFNLFLQAERSLDRSLGGLGIGLSVVKRLTELHGGTVEARSDGERMGSEFVVRLPAPYAPAPAQGGLPVVLAAAPPRRILVVDDNRDAVEALAMMLKLGGNDVEIAYDGVAALATAQSFAPDAVVLDIGLPGMDGYEVARSLRARPETAGALIVAVTGYGQKEDRERSRAAGFDHHLVKPIESDALLVLLRGKGGKGGAATPAAVGSA